MEIQDTSEYFERLMEQSSEYGEPVHRMSDRLHIMPRLFSEEECTEVLNIIQKNFPADYGKIGVPIVDKDDPSVHEVPKESIVINDLRECLVTYIEKTRETAWFLDRIEDAITYINNNVWKFDIRDFSQPPRLMTYYKGHHFQSMHGDAGPGKTSYRKISSILMLSDPDDYAGGEFRLPGEEVTTEMMAKGNLLIFPSILIHCVNPVLEGCRHSLVHRAIGPPFR